MLGLDHRPLVRPKSRVAVFPKNPFYFHIVDHSMQATAQSESDAVKMTRNDMLAGLIRVVQQENKTRLLGSEARKTATVRRSNF
jgi:hypothetical protein